MCSVEELILQQENDVLDYIFTPLIATLVRNEYVHRKPYEKENPRCTYEINTLPHGKRFYTSFTLLLIQIRKLNGYLVRFLILLKS